MDPLGVHLLIRPLRGEVGGEGALRVRPLLARCLRAALLALTEGFLPRLDTATGLRRATGLH
jgi:hypothetical protein